MVRRLLTAERMKDVRVRRILFACVLAVLNILIVVPAQAQQEPEESEEDDAVLRLAEPEYRLVNLPTTLPLPRYRASFDLTHRFVGNLARGSFTEHAKNLFGLDQGALIGFEFRAGLARGLQAAVYRATLDKTFQFHGKWDAVRQRNESPVAVSAIASIEGGGNFTERRVPALGAVVSRSFVERAAIYATPIWVHDTAPEGGPQRDTTLIGVGGRLRISPTVYVVAEVSPRINGYAPGPPEFGFAIEKRAGGHLFQLNFTNTLSTTYGQIARGGSSQTLYLGFNLARKFF
jgi:hypothetical protein